MSVYGQVDDFKFCACCRTSGGVVERRGVRDLTVGGRGLHYGNG